MTQANEALRLLIELCGLGALAYGAWRLGEGSVQKALLMVGLPVAAAVVWATLVAPAAPWRLHGAARFGVEALVPAGAAGALAAAGHTWLGLAFAAAAAVNRALLALLD